MTDIDIHKVLDFMRDNSKLFAQAKAERVYLEEMRKSKKAMLMQQAELNGFKTSATQEREAYASSEYISLLEGLKSAVDREESLRWMLIAAQAKAEVWRSLEASNRAMDRASA